MNLIVRGHNVPISSFLHDHCTDRLERSLRKFGRHVRSAELVFSDENGPRGGGQACRLSVGLSNGERIAAQSVGDNFYAVAQQVAGRVEHLINRELRRRRAHERVAYA